MVIFRRLAPEELKGFHPVFKVVEFAFKVTFVYLYVSEKRRLRVDL